MRERRKRSVAYVDAAGEDFDGGLVVEECDSLIAVARDERDVEGGGDGGVGEIESGELKRGDGERRPVRAVDEVEHGAGGGGNEEDQEDQESHPEADGAAATSPVAPPRRSRAVGRTRGVVELCFACRELRISATVGGGRGGGGTAIGGRLCCWIHSVCHV